MQLTIPVEEGIPMRRTRVLLTGATGYIAAQLLPDLRGRYDLRLTDNRAEGRAGDPVDGVELVDLHAADDARLAELVDGVDVILHAAYQKPAIADAPFDQVPPADIAELYAVERRNVDLAQRIYQTALTGGVRRVVVVSSNQASRWYEQPWHAGRRDRLGPEEYPRPDRFYGWSKAAYENLGFLYACGSLGRQLEVLCVRVVAPREIDAEAFEGREPRLYARDIAGYVSPRDLRQLFRRCIDTEDVADEHGVPFHVFNGVSNNTRQFWSITNARDVLGYAPEDDSEERFAADIAQILYGRPDAIV